jgi:hypothetical protein
LNDFRSARLGGVSHFDVFSFFSHPVGRFSRKKGHFVSITIKPIALSSCQNHLGRTGMSHGEVIVVLRRQFLTENLV